MKLFIWSGLFLSLCLGIGLQSCGITHPKVDEPSKATVANKSESRFDSLYQFYDGLKLYTTGKYHEESNYHRLPSPYVHKVRPVVWRLSQHSAGITLYFETNSPSIVARWTVDQYGDKANMTRIAVSGLDLYAWENQRWQYVNSGIPKGKSSEALLIPDMDGKMRTFRLHLPLYDGIESLSIGVEKGSAFDSQPPPMISPEPPIIIYGTSITQGSSAGRPGMAYPAILSRNLNRSIWNLGFSGNGRFEQAVGEAICEVPASLIVLDCTPNSHPDTIAKNALPLIRQLKACQPNTPILVVESIIREYAYFKKSPESVFGSWDFIQNQNRTLRQIFEKAQAEGYSNLYYLSANQLIGTDHEATVDGTHLTDLGFYRIAQVIGNKINQILTP